MKIQFSSSSIIGFTANKSLFEMTIHHMFAVTNNLVSSLVAVWAAENARGNMRW